MRPEIAIALALACGGWVCTDDNPCPGAKTCETEIAKVCCPLDDTAWCIGACVHACRPEDTVYVCRDEAPPPSCTFTATIDHVACTPADNSGLNFTVTSSGTVTGCDDESIYFERPDGTAYGGLDCGAWTLGQFRSSCLPTQSAAMWSLDDLWLILPGESSEVSVTVKTGAGAVLATTTAACY